MVKNKKLKRMIYGGVGFVMAGVMFFATSMQNMREVSADVRVFDEITQDFPKKPTAAKPFSFLGTIGAVISASSSSSRASIIGPLRRAK